MTNDEREIIESEVEEYAALEGLENTEGGKLLVERLESGITSAIDRMCSGYAEMSHIELITLISRVKEKKTILSSIKTASKSKKEAKKLL